MEAVWYPFLLKSDIINRCIYSSGDYGQAEGRSKNEAEFALVHENPQN